MKKILAPHEKQDGWRYVRVRGGCDPHFTAPAIAHLLGVEVKKRVCLRYDDSRESSRIISSRRVERAVETDDFLRLCAEEGLSPMLHDGEWAVGRWFVSMPTWVEGFYMNKSNGSGVVGIGPTLREAYYRYHAAVGE